MEDTQKYQTWRELLEGYIRDPQERQRIAGALKVTPVTLVRWVRGESRPRPNNLRLLLEILPQHRALLLELLEQEFADLSLEGSNAGEYGSAISSAFYGRVFRAHAALPVYLRFWSICDLILQHALEQFSTEHAGVLITIVSCVPPANGVQVRSLRGRAEARTFPWRDATEHQVFFLGAESLAGYAVTTGRLVGIDTFEDGQRDFPLHQIAREQSALASPICIASRVAGCLLVSSTQPNYFSGHRRMLVQHYADLSGLAFGPKDFHDLQCVNLGIMPSNVVQREHFSLFQQRVSSCMQEALKDGHPIDIMQAEQQVWHQLEEELLQLSSHP